MSAMRGRMRPMIAERRRAMTYETSDGMVFDRLADAAGHEGDLDD